MHLCDDTEYTNSLNDPIQPCFHSSELHSSTPSPLTAIQTRCAVPCTVFTGSDSTLTFHSSITCHPPPSCQKSNPPCQKSNPPRARNSTPPPRGTNPTSPLLSPSIHIVFYSKRAVSISLSVGSIAVFVVHRGTTFLNSFSFSLSVGSIAVFAVHRGTTALNSFSFSQNVDNIAVLVVHRGFCFLN